MKNKEIRSSGEIRDSGETGIVEGYLTKWGSVDSYKSTFIPGAFRRSFSEWQSGTRKIRVFWNHDMIIGKLTEAREDEYGPYVKMQLNLETRAGQDAYAHVKAGDIDGLSFAFFSNTDRGGEKGVREIVDIDVLEVGPVVFPANPQAVITSVRSDNFQETVSENEIRRRGDLLISALLMTLDDIKYKNDYGVWKTKTELAITQFSSEYLKWVDEYVTAINPVSISVAEDNIRFKNIEAALKRQMENHYV